MKHRDNILIQKIISEISIALKLMNNTEFKDFDDDEMLKRAVCMTVINIGELVKSITEETRGSNKDIPWKSIAGFRDIAAHKYGTLRMESVYQTVMIDFPVLKEQLNKIEFTD